MKRSTIYPRIFPQRAKGGEGARMVHKGPMVYDCICGLILGVIVVAFGSSK